MGGGEQQVGGFNKRFASCPVALLGTVPKILRLLSLKLPYHQVMGHPAIDIDGMPPEDRLKLIGELWDSLQRQPESIPFPETHRKEIHARLDAIDRGEAEVVEWDEALRRLRQ
jgi:putative addiction module component (TIGR02574 family)